MIEFSRVIESPVNSKATPPSEPASFRTIEQFRNLVFPLGAKTPCRLLALFPIISQLMKVEPVEPVLKKAKPPFEVELEFASFPNIRILLKTL